MLTSPLFVALLACAPPPDDVGFDRPESDEPGESHTAVHDPAEPDPPTVEARITPDNPNFDDDLRCNASLPERVETITWTVDGTPWNGPTGTTNLPGDTVDDLNQSGGQVWSCTIRLRGGASLTSPTVRVRHPVPMVVAPPGSTQITDHLPRPLTHNVTITRAYWLAETELTRDQWYSLTGLAVPAFNGGNWSPIRPDNPVSRAVPLDAFWFADHLSALDGLPTCYHCSAEREGATCVRPEDPYACLGYRLPTRAEWVLAYREGGQHSDQLPAGGSFALDASSDAEGMAYIADATGPNAPPGTTTADQCWTGATTPYDDNPARSLLPNGLGLFNMCSNAPEFFTDVYVYCRDQRVDPACNPADMSNTRTTGRSGMQTFATMPGIRADSGGDSAVGGIRITRTLPTQANP